MIRINLLPHREIKRAARQRQFISLAIATLVVGLGVVFLVHAVFSTLIEQQNSRNTFLQAEIAKLDKQIEEIKKLKEQTQALLERKRVVETLQANRAEVVRLMDQLVKQLPDGVYLKAVKQTGLKVNLNGYAQSSARVSTLMRNLESSPWLMSAELVEIKAASIGTQRLNEFSLNISLKRQLPEEDKKGSQVKGKKA